jgi:glycosyltransferase involved in cell wall biosynthesis
MTAAQIDAEMDAGIDSRPLVAIYRAPLFNPSETFIQAQAASLSKYRPLIVGREDKGNVIAELRGRTMIGRNLVERLRPLRPALVHAHFGIDGVAALPIARALGVPLVTTLHGHEIGRSRLSMALSGRLSWQLYALLQPRLAREGALFLAVSDAIRREAIARGFPEERTVTHRIGVDLRLFPAAGEPQPGLVLHVGRLVEKKGTADLIDAFARVQSEAELVIIGDGPLRPALERRADGLNVRFLGWRPTPEVRQWMSRAWLLAVPSVTAADGDREGLPTVAVEAAAAGLPVVGTRHSGIPEAVTDGRSGLLVAEGDVSALGDRLDALLGSADMRRRMSAAARALAEERFDLARQTRILERHYDRLLTAR